VYTHNTPTQNQTQVYSHDGRVIGAVYGRTFCKVIAFSRHALRRPPALAVDECALSQAREAGAEGIRIKDSESGKVYSVSIPFFKEHAFLLDRGFGRQYALPILYWTVRDSEGNVIQTPPVVRAVVEQIALPLGG
jgi:hypothetical protein